MNIGMGLIRINVGRSVHSTVVGSACAGLEFDASCHKVGFSNVHSVGDIVFLWKMMTSISCALIVSAEQYRREALDCWHRVSLQHFQSKLGDEWCYEEAECKFISADS